MLETEEEADKKREKAIRENISIYLDDIQHISTALKGDALLRNNFAAYASAQGAIDVVLDIKELLAGGEIESLAALKKEFEKAKKEKSEEETPYLY